MAASFGSLSGSLSLTTGAFTKGVAVAKAGLGSLVSSFASVGATLASYGATFGLALGGLAVVGGGYLLTLGADLTELNSKFALYFGESTKSADEFANALAGSIGRSVVETKKAMSSFQSLMVPLGLTGETSTKLSQSLTKLGYDLGSVNNMDPTEVMDRLRSAMTGSGEAVASLGIVLNEATLKNEMFSMGLKGQFSDLSEAQKAMVRYSVIVKASDRAIGDALNTSGSWSNQWLALKAKIFDTASTLGVMLSDYLTPFLQGVNYGITLLGSIAMSFGSIGSIGKPSFETIKTVIDTVIFSFLNWDLTLKKIGLTIVEFAANSWNQLKAFYMNIGIGLVWMYDNWKSIFTTIYNFTTSVFTNLWTNLSNGFQELWRWISSGFQGSLNINFTPLLDGFQSAITKMPEFVSADKADYSKAWDEIRTEEEKRWKEFNEKIKPKDKSAEQKKIVDAGFLKAGDVKGELDKQKANPKKASGTSENKAISSGSAELQSRLYGLNFGQAQKEKLEKQMLNAQEDAMNSLRKIVRDGIRITGDTVKI